MTRRSITRGEKRVIQELVEKLYKLSLPGPITDERIAQIEALGLTAMELAQMLENGEFIDDPTSLARAQAVGQAFSARMKQVKYML